MLTVPFPQAHFDIRKEDGKEWIKDIIRKKWVRLTPEEWVRQNWIQYFVTVKKYPAALLSIEKEIKIGEVRKRCDIVVYKEDKPWMIVECKQPGVMLSEDTLMQALRYNMAGCCSYLIISNGDDSKGWQIENENAREISDLPDWK